MENLPKWRQCHTYWIELKTLLQKEKLLVLSNFFFCHNVFKCRQTCSRGVKKASICGKGLKFNSFPYIDAFWRLCNRRLFENIVTKEEIAENEQFLLLPQCFLLLVIDYPFNYRDFLFFDKICSVVCYKFVVWGKGLRVCRDTSITDTYVSG